jgi:hypothetical protein
MIRRSVEGKELIAALDQIGQNDQAARGGFAAQRNMMPLGSVSADE